MAHEGLIFNSNISEAVLQFILGLLAVQITKSSSPNQLRIFKITTRDWGPIRPSRLLKSSLMHFLHNNETWCIFAYSGWLIFASILVLSYCVWLLYICMCFNKPFLVFEFEFGVKVRRGLKSVGIACTLFCICSCLHESLSIINPRVSYACYSLMLTTRSWLPCFISLMKTKSSSGIRPIFSFYPRLLFHSHCLAVYVFLLLSEKQFSDLKKGKRMSSCVSFFNFISEASGAVHY